MANEIIIAFRRLGFPKETLDEGSYRNTIEYIGPAEELSGQVTNGIVWGDYPGLVTSCAYEPIEGTDYAILTVVVERKFESADYPGTGQGVEQEINYEIDWVDVQRPMIEHPKFRLGAGGTYALTGEDIAAIESWKDNPSPEYKELYLYSNDGWKTEPDSLNPELSTNAKMFARGIELGIEYYIDKAPVARKSITYAGGPPPEGSAGQKEDPPTDFEGIPTGYQWIRTADRGLRRGGQTRWNRDIEWTGAKIVQVDRDEIFWSAPA